MEPVHPQLLSRSDFQLLEHHCPVRLQTHLSGLRDVLWYWNHRRLRRHHCGHRLQWSLLHTSEGISHHIPRYSFLRLIPGV